MNRKTALKLAALALAGASAAVACATADDSPTTPTDLSDGGGLVLEGGLGSDAGPPTPEEDAAPPTCSHAGWCKTPLPDIELQFQDIWPLETRAFALVQDESQGVRFMEWDGTSWQYIDDQTQNDLRVGAQTVWAPSEYEVFFVLIDGSFEVGGMGGGQIVYHGTRPAIGMPWTWTHEELGCATFDFSGALWGSSATDVWATACAKIYHRETTDAGAPAWVVKYTDTGPPGELDTARITGTGPDDVWVTFARSGNCIVAFHKDATGLHQLSDGAVDGAGDCVKKGAFVRESGQLNDLTATEPGVAVGAYKVQAGGNMGHSTMKLSLLPDAGVAFTEDDPPVSLPVTFDRSWAASSSSVWIIGNSQVVIDGEDLYHDAHKYEYSTIALNGAPNTSGLLSIRGTSNTNIWLGGMGLAYHKTTP